MTTADFLRRLAGWCAALLIATGAAYLLLGLNARDWLLVGTAAYLVVSGMVSSAIWWLLHRTWPPHRNRR
ncbi:hypothetical protein ACTQ49_14290 [Luteococcus sp. Sow4_B9]|uniref:hypothetical protein n=1 Tax=Luteococcus sp. Sow4_B9 TaxID=3438792 RepID=UPI003F9A845D